MTIIFKLDRAVCDRVSIPRLVGTQRSLREFCVLDLLACLTHLSYDPARPSG